MSTNEEPFEPSVFDLPHPKAEFIFRVLFRQLHALHGGDGTDLACFECSNTTKILTNAVMPEIAQIVADYEQRAFLRGVTKERRRR